MTDGNQENPSSAGGRRQLLDTNDHTRSGDQRVCQVLLVGLPNLRPVLADAYPDWVIHSLPRPSLSRALREVGTLSLPDLYMVSGHFYASNAAELMAEVVTRSHSMRTVIVINDSEHAQMLRDSVTHRGGHGEVLIAHEDDLLPLLATFLLVTGSKYRIG